MNTIQTINKALIHHSKIISCSLEPIGYINTPIKVAGYEPNIRVSCGVGEMKREQSEECHDHDRLRVLN